MLAACRAAGFSPRFGQEADRLASALRSRRGFPLRCQLVGQDLCNQAGSKTAFDPMRTWTLYPIIWSVVAGSDCCTLPNAAALTIPRSAL
jgi:hypothetical protein